jgi:hypothetical protein
MQHPGADRRRRRKSRRRRRRAGVTVLPVCPQMWRMHTQQQWQLAGHRCGSPI